LNRCILETAALRVEIFFWRWAGTFSPITALMLRTAMIVFVVGVQHHNLVAEEAGCTRPPMGDQGLARR
jgi:hypothetical protein